jgi:hypothetical protein
MRRGVLPVLPGLLEERKMGGESTAEQFSVNRDASNLDQ